MEFWYKGQHFFDSKKEDVAAVKKLLKKNKHVIVSGGIGRGKSSFCKYMSKSIPDIVYCEVQYLITVETIFRKEALYCIEIQQINNTIAHQIL